MEHDLPEDRFGIQVEKTGVWPITDEKWQYDFVPTPTDQCDLCAKRTSKGKDPLCVPDPERFRVGEQTRIFTEDGLPLAVKLLEIDHEGNGHFDFNLPLAGKTLNFDRELVEVR